jgi:hypothetical protein
MDGFSGTTYPVGSGYRPVAGSCEYGDEPSGSGATELVSYRNSMQLRYKCKKSTHF